MRTAIDTKLNRIQISEVKSLIYLKTNSTKEQDICVNVDIQDYVRVIPIDKLQFVRVISIILDNAIENAENSLKKEMCISIYRNNGVIYFDISNSVDQQNIDIDKLFDKGFTTKKTADKEDHGLGLNFVKSIVSNSNVIFLRTKLKDGTFTQSIQMKVVL